MNIRNYNCTPALQPLCHAAKDAGVTLDAVWLSEDTYSIGWWDTVDNTLKNDIEAILDEYDGDIKNWNTVILSPEDMDDLCMAVEFSLPAINGLAADVSKRDTVDAWTVEINELDDPDATKPPSLVLTNDTLAIQISEQNNHYEVSVHLLNGQRPYYEVSGVVSNQECAIQTARVLAHTYTLETGENT